MTTMWSSAITSLDDSLALLGESLGKLNAAQSVDLAEVIEQIRLAAQSARNVRYLAASELPGAAWQNREELDALVAEELNKTAETGPLDGIAVETAARAPEPAHF